MGAETIRVTALRISLERLEVVAFSAQSERSLRENKRKIKNNSRNLFNVGELNKYS